MGHEVFNYGMCGAEDPNSLTYVQNGILAAVLLNSGAADFVITGCGTGEGAMLACNSFPKVLCGHIESPLDAYLFSQVNDGNCVALPFAENFGWGGELNLQYTFEKLFCAPGGGGYPPERVVPEQRNKKILDQVKEVTHTDMVTILKNLDRELVKGALSGAKFKEYFDIVSDNTDSNMYSFDIHNNLLKNEAGQYREIRFLSPGCKDLAGICMRFAFID